MGNVRRRRWATFSSRFRASSVPIPEAMRWTWRELISTPASSRAKAASAKECKRAAASAIISTTAGL